jgi:hypothetical protein
LTSIRRIRPLLGFIQQDIEDQLPDTLLSSTPKAAVDGLPRSVALRQITPRSTSTHQPDDGIDDQTVGERWGGNNGWISSHCASVSSPRRTMTIRHQGDDSFADTP